MIPGGLTPIRLKPLTSVRKLDPPTMAIGPPPCSTSIFVLGVTTVLPLENGARLRDLRRLGDADRQRPVGYRDRRNLHVLADDDRAGSRVQNDARGHVRLDLQLADLRHEPRERDIVRAEQFDGAAVDFVGRMGAESLARIGVDRVDDPAPRSRNRDSSIRASCAIRPAAPGTSCSTIAPLGIRPAVGTPCDSVSP